MFESLFSFSSQEFWQQAGNILLSLLVVVLVIFEIWLVNKISRYFQRKVENINFKTFKIHSFELISPGKQKLFLQTFIKVLQIFAILLIIYFSLIIVLGLFPGTEGVVDKLINFIFSPLKKIWHDFVSYLPNLFSIIITVVVFHYLKRIVKVLSKEIQKGNINVAGFEPYWARTTASIVVFVLNALMIIFILPKLPGYESLAFKGIATFLGALLTIGGSSVIANYMSGIVISYMNPYRMGDIIKIDDITGKVVEISIFAVKIQTPKLEIVSIPYNKVLSNKITNYGGRDKGKGVYLNTTTSIGYDVPWQKVNELLIKAAKNTRGIDLTNTPFVRQAELGDHNVVYELNAYSTEIEKMPIIYSELHKNILDVFNEARIEILSPVYEAARDGSGSTIPKENK